MSYLKEAALYTDLYELTMAQAFFYEGKKGEVAVFDYYYRENPFNGGYVLFAGLKELLEVITGLNFSIDQIDFLKTLGFKPMFLDYLKSFSFSGDFFSVKEGEVIFPLTPVIRIKAPIIEAQIIETLLLNIINFSSLIATKASRIKYSASGRVIMDFGLRRAQGLGSFYASSAAYIGGVEFTSNVSAGQHLGIPLSGTMGHSWIQSFSSELEAFLAYAKIYPEKTVLLVDTYDTLKSGIPNAIIVAKFLRDQGYSLKAIRIDSGDLAYLSKQARILLNQAGFENVKIAVSNQLDEYIIKSLLEQSAPIDIFGVGTRLVTGHHDGALDGVYKLSKLGSVPRIKISENIAKINWPEEKQLIRLLNEDGDWIADGVTLCSEKKIKRIYHPIFHEKFLDTSTNKSENLLVQWIKNGNLIQGVIDIHNSAKYAKERLNKLPQEYKRFEFPHQYKIGVSKKLLQMQKSLISKFRNHD